MTSFLVESILLLALGLTSLQVYRMHRELKRMKAYHLEFQKVFEQTESALESIQMTVRELHASGREIVEELGIRIDAGRLLLRDLASLGIERGKKSA